MKTSKKKKKIKILICFRFQGKMKKLMYLAYSRGKSIVITVYFFREGKKFFVVKKG